MKDFVEIKLEAVASGWDWNNKYPHPVRQSKSYSPLCLACII